MRRQDFQEPIGHIPEGPELGRRCPVEEDTRHILCKAAWVLLGNQYAPETAVAEPGVTRVLV